MKTKRLSLMLPFQLYAKIKDLAQKERRSIHAQILYILEGYFTDKEQD